MIKPGIYPNLSNEDYHADGAISRSGIMDFLDSPYKYWANYLNCNRPAKKSTKEMEFGSAFHTYMLESDKFENEYCSEPVYMETPKRVLLKDVGRPMFDTYKAEKARIDFINANIEEQFNEEIIRKGKKIIKNEDLNILFEMRAALLNHPEAKALIENAIYEQSYFWEDEHTGIMCKARPDILHSHIIVDLKTIQSASSRYYQRAMIDGGYHIQGAMIREGVFQCTGVDIKSVINICIEKTYPYQIGIKIIGEDALEAGKAAFKQALLDLKRCIEYNEFLSYDAEIVNLPSWAK